MKRLFEHNVFVFWFFTIGWAVFFLITRTPWSGYHFMDDHQIIVMAERLKTESLLDVIGSYLQNDIKIRLRPVYYILRVTKAWVFGDNLFLWSLSRVFELIFTSFFLYKSAQYLSYTFWIRLLFVGLITLSPANEIWWLLGPAEVGGMLYLSISLYLLLKSQKRYPKKQYLQILSLVLATIACLFKESFVLMLPALAWFIMLDLPDFSRKEIWMRLREYQHYILTLAIICIGLLGGIIFLIGTNSLGYAGIEGGKSSFWYSFFNLKEEYNLKGVVFHFLLQILNPSTYLKGWYAPTLILSLLLLVIHRSLEKESVVEGIKKVVTKEGVLFILVFLIVLPQFILYLKTGLWKRYYLPIAMGFAVLITHVIHILIKERLPVGQIILSVAFFSLTYLGVFNINRALIFKTAGINSTQLLATISQKSKKGDVKSILVVAEPVANAEFSSSIATYLTIKTNIDTVYYHFISAWSYEEEFQERLYEREINNSLNTQMKGLENKVHQEQYIVAFPPASTKFEETYPSIINTYKKTSFGEFVLYEKP